MNVKLFHYMLFSTLHISLCWLTHRSMFLYWRFHNYFTFMNRVPKYMFSHDLPNLNNVSIFLASKWTHQPLKFPYGHKLVHIVTRVLERRWKLTVLKNCFKLDRLQKCNFTIFIISNHLKGFYCLIYYAKLFLWSGDLPKEILSCLNKFSQVQNVQLGFTSQVLITVKSESKFFFLNQ